MRHSKTWLHFTQPFLHTFEYSNHKQLVKSYKLRGCCGAQGDKKERGDPGIVGPPGTPGSFRGGPGDPSV